MINKTKTFILYTTNLFSSGRTGKIYLHAFEPAPSPTTTTRGKPINIGFSYPGLTKAKSPAAKWQSKIGNSVAKSPFATAQSMGTRGMPFTVSGPLANKGKFKMRGKWVKCVDWLRTEMVEGLTGEGESAREGQAA
ncbi:uncharacterized protein H6S33_012678 [Morchella sextelata]|uniref:uncharacterized protein n=1 Tax=Morchella sextelata TaxID=1174677 RepID=UPI001D042906|nr:uncharacterized protein H6S33_012678 [Morchella sextelata]KAH0610132.1 hypothetical protein H6S33_012678 [Morchella sextelata]